jgi:hypothetical protein
MADGGALCEYDINVARCILMKADLSGKERMKCYGKHPVAGERANENKPPSTRSRKVVDN